MVFGSRIIDLPLARRQLMKIMLATEQALSMSFLTADALDRAEAGSQDAAALLRILTPTLKFRATRDARKVCGDALEMRGGIGYIEEFATARLLRDAHLGSIWEGTGNIVAIDALKRAVGRHGADSALAADLHARLDDSARRAAGLARPLARPRRPRHRLCPRGGGAHATTRPRRGAPPACSIMSPAPSRWPGRAGASTRCAATRDGCCCRGW